MSVFSALLGTSSPFFRIGLQGPRLKNDTGVLSVRDAADTIFARVKGGAPIDDQDLVTKFYADSLSKPIIVSRQANTSASIPPNTAVRGFVVVTTAGTGASIGDLLYDDGSNGGTMQILPAIEGRTIAVTDALSGGTVSFDPDSIYIWDDDNTIWVKIGDIGAVVGAVRLIRYILDNSASQDSISQIPASSRVVKVRLEVTGGAPGYSGGATISVGIPGGLTDFMLTTENDPQSVAAYEKDQDTQVVSAAVVRTTVAGTPAAGTGVVIVWHSNPQN